MKTMILTTTAPIHSVVSALGAWSKNPQINLNSTTDENRRGCNIEIRLTNWTHEDRSNFLESVLILLNDAGIKWNVI